MTDHRQPNKHRLTAVLSHELPDRVPNFEVLVENPTLRHILGRDLPGGHTLANIDPKDYIEFVDRIGQDVIGLCFYDNPFRYRDDQGKTRPLDFPIRSRDDMERVFVANLDHQAKNFQLLERYVEAVAGTEIGLFVLLGSFFTSAYDSIFGFENFMHLLYDDRSLIEQVLQEHSAYYATMAERLVEYPLTFFYIGDDLAYKTGTLIRPQMMREMWVPCMRRVCAPALQRGIPILFHSDGNVEALIPDLIDMGICALNPIEPYGMDIRAIKKRFGRRLTLVGNLDVGGALSRGTPQQVRAEAQQLIDDVGYDGGLVLASCHSITSNVKPENFLAMVDTAQTYGVY